MKVVILNGLSVTWWDRKEWKLDSPLFAQVHEGESTRHLCVPADFVTDFETVPRIPFAYEVAANVATKAAVIHDWLYFTQAGRLWSDRVFLGAMKAEGVPLWRRWLMFGAVRAFGWIVYERRGRLPGTAVA